MPTLPVVLKPGPRRIAAALQIAGFGQNFIYPSITDQLGKVWPKPSMLLIAVAIAGAESSGHAWIYRQNADSYDFGLMEINNKYNPETFKAPATPLVPTWTNYVDNAKAAHNVWSDARDIRIRKYGRSSHMWEDWKPWHAWPAGATRERYGGKTWLDWAQFGIDELNSLLKAGKTVEYCASIDMDPLIYWK